MPDKVSIFRRALEAMARNMPKGMTPTNLFQSGSTDELLEQAKAEQNASLRDLLYTRAATSAMMGGDSDQALSIVEKMENKERRASIGTLVRLQAAEASIKKGDIDKALRYANTVEDLRQRAFLLGKIARAMLDKNDAGRASEILDDAVRTIGKADESITKANALLIIAEVRSRLDPMRGFEALETAVKAFNRADDVSQASKDHANTPTEGTDVMAMMLNSAFKLDQPGFDPVFSRLAKTDFQRAIQIARSLEKKERSIPAQLAACRGVLSVS